ncbi:formimidoylglutamate deiminase [Pseudorhodobacter wandonensis]|uniref:formimidoylglutamate deiminase n=1 Tax=Pseudorhodobacter wandonensis TaxID=1120568 RepID=UPI0009E41943|nr:formimidoylglutamate deiminase [Pseudorhodobacter wandonensis]
MIFAERALLPDRWAEQVRITVADGHITGVATAAAPQSGDARVSALLPALSNLHSHAFQRAMAGMTEHRIAGRDSFWTWRDLMYRFLDRLTPEQMEAIAALVFMEMQEAGYAAVGEFHYVHHQPGGGTYADIAELSNRIFAAAHLTGIGLTHLPVLYTYGGAGQQPLAAGQLRFGNTVDGFADLLEATRTAARALPADTRVGIAPHSLRATNPADLARALPLAAGNPIHIHVAEQPKEVADISAWLGARPVEWLLANTPIGADWCAIHATHMTAQETATLAKSGAVAGLCPITEANLGDGPFNGPGWLAAGGAFGIGSDSNVRISLTEELRTLEYSQRLRDIARNVMVEKDGSVGQCLYVGAALGGAQALGRKSGQIETGFLADLTAIDLSHPTLCALAPDQILDGLAFAAPDTVITDLWSAGRHQVKEGRHLHRDQIITTWRKAVKALIDAV